MTAHMIQPNQVDDIMTPQGSNRDLHKITKMSLSYSWKGIMQALP